MTDNNPTSYPTSMPTINSTSPGQSNSDVGNEIGVAVIAGIISASIVGMVIIFQKLICFKIFDSYGAGRGFFQDICSCYQKEWQEINKETHEQDQSDNHQIAPAKQTKDDSSDIEKGISLIDNLKDEGSILSTGAIGVLSIRNPADIALEEDAAQTLLSSAASMHNLSPSSTNSSLAGELIGLNDI